WNSCGVGTAVVAGVRNEVGIPGRAERDRPRASPCALAGCVCVCSASLGGARTQGRSEPTDCRVSAESFAPNEARGRCAPGKRACMSPLTSLPFSPVEPVTDIFHGTLVTDPYRWLEDPKSARTRAWIEQQTCYARSYLDAISGRAKIRARIRELLAVETYDSVHKSGSRYFFRKRLPEQEQPC